MKKYLVINEVCDYARISRSTFYRSYQDLLNAHPDTRWTKTGRPRYSQRSVEEIILRGNPPKQDGDDYPPNPPLPPQSTLPGF